MPIELVCLPIARRLPRVLCAFAVGLSLSIVVLGCGQGGPKLIPVTGIVTINGTPLVDANVEFIPEKGFGSYGRTDETGEYELLYRARSKGATLGRHQVRISTAIEQDLDSANPYIRKGRPESIPAKYNTNSTLEVNLEAGSSGKQNFDLQSENKK